MVTFDGKVGMCCHDWGAQHCIGYVDKRAFQENVVIDDLEKSILKNKKGFELLKNAKKPQKFNTPEKKVQNIYEIWNGDELNKIRLLHKSKELNKIDICKDCNFKDTYKWSKIL